MYNGVAHIRKTAVSSLKTLGFSGGNNSKRQIEMEKEIENLKWHLSIVSSIIVGVRKEVLKLLWPQSA